MRLLIAYDGSKCAEAAIEGLRRCGLPETGEALVVTVDDTVQGFWESLNAAPAERGGWDPMAIPTADRLETATIAKIDLIASRTVRHLRADWPRWHIEARAFPGEAKKVIVREARNWNADLVVVGSQGKSAMNRLFLGSVSQAVIHEAPCSVHIVRHFHQYHGATIHLLAGTDGSGSAAAAVEEIARRNWPKGTEVRVVGVIEGTVNPAIPAAALAGGISIAQYSDNRRRIIEVVEAAKKKLTDAGLWAISTIREGEAGHILVEEAKKMEADCVFIGSRNLGRLGRIVLGSVSSYVAAHAHCSVELVRQRG